MSNKKPNPGTKEALDLGCDCPTIDNHYGQGVPGPNGPLFWMNRDCPLHGLTKETHHDGQ